MKQHVMSIHTKAGATVVTRARFAMRERCKRFKRELSANKNSGFKSWGVK